MPAPFSDYAVIVNPKDVGALKADNIAVAKADIPSGEELQINGQATPISRPIPRGCSFAVREICKDESIIALGVHVGFASRRIAAGGYIDPSGLGNMRHELTGEEPQLCSLATETPHFGELANRTFKGFRRKVTVEGKEGAGTQNIVAILNTVKCSQTTTQNIAHMAKQKLLPRYSNVTDVVAITQEYGCGMPVGKAKAELARLLVAIMNCPNVGALYVLGLGCEHLCPIPGVEGSVFNTFAEKVIDFEERVQTDHLQHYRSELAAVNEIVDGPLRKTFEAANQYEREPLPIRHLTLGLKCGGSDRFSGVTANPALGVAVDRLIHGGGAAIITETPEFEGYMHVLAERSRDEETARWLLGMIPRFDEVSKTYPIPESGRQQVTPGNFKGGLLNIFMKAAGAAAKAGSTVIEGGLEYGDSIYEHDRRGLWVLDCPSYDQISTPALALSGCQMVVFTTGRGTPIGSALGQVVKVASTSNIGLDQHVDFFADGILNGESLESVGEAMFEKILAIASGNEPTAIETWNQQLLEAGLPHQHYEFMPWKRWADN